MKKRPAFQYTILSGWLITALAIVLVAPLFVAEEYRSDYFWYRVLWTEVLCLLFWVSASFYFLVSSAQKDSVTRFGGIAPTVSIVTAVYALLSFSVMVIHAFLYASDTTNRIHWILQITFLAVAALSVVFLSVAREAATSRLAFDNAKAHSPKELHDLLAVQETSLRSPASHELRASIKQLREALVYSLNESASLAERPDYQELCRGIETLCESIAGLPSANEKNADQFNSLCQSAITLTTKTKLIASNQIRR